MTELISWYDMILLGNGERLRTAELGREGEDCNKQAVALKQGGVINTVTDIRINYKGTRFWKEILN
jgi:hypothetical protein